MRLYGQYFRELSTLLALVLAAIIVLSCGPSVRNKEVYAAEIDFMEAAAEEQVERGIAVIKEYCVCDEVAGAKGFTSEECHNLAETILVVQYRMKYHTEFMRYLGGISKRRPPEKPFDVPDPGSLCPGDGGSPDGPMPIPDELDYPDAGVDAGD